MTARVRRLVLVRHAVPELEPGVPDGGLRYADLPGGTAVRRTGAAA